MEESGDANSQESPEKMPQETAADFFFGTFIEKVHLKKYTDILPFTDGRYRPSTRVHSLHCFMIPPAPDITSIPVFSTSVGVFLGGGLRVGKGMVM